MLLSAKVDLSLMKDTMSNCNGNSSRVHDTSQEPPYIQGLHCLSKLGRQIAKIEN